METQFIPYEQALALKELGFDEPCFGCYEMIEIRDYKKGLKINKAFVLNTINGCVKYDGIGQTPSPKYHQVFRFFKAKYNLDCIVTTNYERFKIKIIKIFESKTYPKKNQSFPTIYDDNFENKFTCIEEVDLELIKKLIQIVKNEGFEKNKN
jgi:hypothetical protein